MPLFHTDLYVNVESVKIKKLMGSSPIGTP